jgi:hypothetical protein
MRESFTYGSVGRAPGNRCLYPEADRLQRRLIFVLGVSSQGTKPRDKRIRQRR